MSFKEKIKAGLVLSFTFMLMRQFLVFGDLWGCLFFAIILLSLIISEG